MPAMPVIPPTARDRAAWRFDLRASLLCGAAALLAGLVYLNVLHNPFVYDDYHTVVANASLRDVANVRGIILHDVTRPLVNFSYAIDHALWGAKPLGYHVTNVLLHMLNVILLFLLARRLTQDRLVAFAAASLFAVHPMMTEAVGYISGRSEVLCATWVLLGVLCGLRWMNGDGGTWAVLTVALWGVALATKETAAMFPFVLVACDWSTVPGSAAERRRRFVTLYVPLMATAAIAGIGRLMVLRVEYPGQVSVHWRYALLELDVARRYIWLLMNPAGQTLFHEVTAIRGLFEPRALLALAASGLLLALAWRLRKVERIASLGIVWFLLLLIPSAALAVLDQGEPMAEHRVYLASCGAFLAAGAGIGRLGDWMVRRRPRMRWVGATALALVLSAFSAETLLRNAVWADPVTLWRESVDLAPIHFRPRLLLGEALQDAGRREEAVEQYKIGIRLRPMELTGYVKLGLCLAEMGRLSEARQSLRDAVAVDPHNGPARRALALLEKMGPAS
jgi:protein O-mannosyl-transferase